MAFVGDHQAVPGGKLRDIITPGSHACAWTSMRLTPAHDTNEPDESWIALDEMEESFEAGTCSDYLAVPYTHRIDDNPAHRLATRLTCGSADRTHQLVQVSQRVIARLAPVGVLAPCGSASSASRHTHLRRYANGRRARTVHDPAR